MNGRKNILRTRTSLRVTRQNRNMQRNREAILQLGVSVGSCRPDLVPDVGAVCPVVLPDQKTEHQEQRLGQHRCWVDLAHSPNMMTSR